MQAVVYCIQVVERDTKEYQMNKFIEANTRKEAIKKFDGEFEVAKKVCGGWMFFQTVSDYETWKNQK